MTVTVFALQGAFSSTLAPVLGISPMSKDTEALERLANHPEGTVQCWIMSLGGPVLPNSCVFLKIKAAATQVGYWVSGQFAENRSSEFKSW